MGTTGLIQRSVQNRPAATAPPPSPPAPSAPAAAPAPTTAAPASSAAASSPNRSADQVNLSREDDDANDNPATARLLDTLSGRDDASESTAQPEEKAATREAGPEEENAAVEAGSEEESAALQAQLSEEIAALQAQLEALEKERDAAAEQAAPDEPPTDPPTSEQPPVQDVDTSAAPPAHSTAQPVAQRTHSGGGGSYKGPSVGLKAPNGFLWKPVSDSDGRLAILLPPGLTGQVKEVRVLSPDGSQVLATGRSGGVGNGGREHFRFGAAGGAFPPGCIVQIVMKDGSTQEVPIAQPQMRGEGRG